MMKKLITILFYIITVLSIIIALYILITGHALVDINILALIVVFIGISSISIQFLKGKDDTLY